MPVFSSVCLQDFSLQAPYLSVATASAPLSVGQSKIENQDETFEFGL